MRQNETLKLIPALLALALLVPAVPSQAAGPTSRIQYSKSKDGRYIYIRSAAQLEIGNPEQTKALGIAFERIKEQINDLKAKSPRVGNIGKIDDQAIRGAAEFDKNIDGIVTYMQKYYGELDSLRQYANIGTPTALVGFLGVNWSRTQGWSVVKVVGGASVVMGVVLLPQNVRRIEVDTGKIEEYFDFDSNLVFWPTGNLGLAVAPGTVTPAPAPAPQTTASAGGGPLASAEGGLLGGYQRFGIGLIWGRLDQASDFHGMVTGVSVTPGGWRARANFKLQALTNFSKKQAISNVFATAAFERGNAPDLLEINGSLGWVVDAASFLGASTAKVGSPEEALAAAAARTVDKDSTTSVPFTTTPSTGPTINPLPLNPNIPPLIQ